MAFRPSTTHGTGRRSLARLATTAATAAALFMLSAASALAASPPWPVDGQNSFSQRSSDRGPASVSAAKVAWQRTWDAPVIGTPVISDNGGVYVGDVVGDVHGFVYKNGERAWATGGRNIGGPIFGSLLYLSTQKCTPDTSTLNGCVYAVASTTGSPRVVALDPFSGDVKWTSPALDTQSGVDAWGSPTYSAAKNLIYVPLCACKAIANAQANPVNASIPSARGGVVALNATTGAIAWKSYTVGATYTGGAVAGTPLVNDATGRLYVGTDGSYQSGRVDPNTDSVLALDTGTGAIVARFQARAGDYFSPIDQTHYTGFAAGPILFTKLGKTYIGAGSKDGNFYALDPATLAKSWSATVAPGSQLGGIQAASAWDKNAKLFGVGATPGAYWSLATTGGLGWLMPGNDVKHSGPVTYGKSYVWSADTDGFLNIQSGADGHPVARIVLPGRSTGGVSFGYSLAFVGVGMVGGTSGGVVAVK